MFRCKHKKLEILVYHFFENPPHNDAYFAYKCKKCNYRFNYEWFWTKKDYLKQLLKKNRHYGFMTFLDMLPFLNFDSQKELVTKYIEAQKSIFDKISEWIKRKKALKN